jgi:hypothetical protein
MGGGGVRRIFDAPPCIAGVWKCGGICGAGRVPTHTADVGALFTAGAGAVLGALAAGATGGAYETLAAGATGGAYETLATGGVGGVYETGA